MLGNIQSCFESMGQSQTLFGFQPFLKKNNFYLDLNSQLLSHGFSLVATKLSTAMHHTDGIELLNLCDWNPNHFLTLKTLSRSRMIFVLKGSEIEKET